MNGPGLDSRGCAGGRAPTTTTTLRSASCLTLDECMGVFLTCANLPPCLDLEPNYACMSCIARLRILSEVCPGCVHSQTAGNRPSSGTTS